MKNLCSIILCFFALTIAVQGQTKRVNGIVRGADNDPLNGVSVQVENTSTGTFTNEDGFYSLSTETINSSQVTLVFTYSGYESIKKEVSLSSSAQELDVRMKPLEVALQAVIVTAQKRSEELVDVPVAVSVLGRTRLNNLGTTNLDELSDFIPGLNIQVQSNQRPGYVIRGITSDGNDPNSQPRVSVYYDNIPINRASGAVVEPYDMARIEVVKGPQGTLFGRGAQIGAVHFIPQKPKNKFELGAKGSYGSYNMANLTAFVNTPISDRVAVRLAGTIDRMDGFVTNTFGGTLNGKNTLAGRATLQVLPSDNFKINFMVDYQNDDAPGVAFVTKNLPNTNGESGAFLQEASLEQGEALGASKENTLTSLNLQYELNENLSLTSVSSYRWHTAFERYDGDGSAARTLDFSEENNAQQFYQELRLNASIGNKFRGVLGGSFFREDVDREFIFRFDEQSVATFFFLRDPSRIVDSTGNPVLFPAIPQSVPGLGGVPLPTDHQESRFQRGINSSTQIFIDGSFDITDKLSLTAGLRLVMDNISVEEKTIFIESSDPSVLGNLTRRAPNLFSPVQEFPRRDTASMALTGRAVVQYEFTNNSNIYLTYSRGRRPEAIEFRNDGSTDVLTSETIDNYELGFKSLLNDRTSIGLAAFYHDYSNFRTTAFIDIDSLTGGTPEVFQSNAGEATALGLELDLAVAISKNISAFGNYNFIRARFANEDSDGQEQEYAGNMFRLTPDHSFALGLNAKFPLSEKAVVFLLPTYSFKSMHFFDDSNPVDETNPNDVSLNSNQFQEAFGLLNLNLGLEIPASGVKIVLFSRNLLNQQYVIDAGNTGAAILGQATYVQGRPRILGARIEWNLTK